MRNSSFALRSSVVGLLLPVLVGLLVVSGGGSVDALAPTVSTTTTTIPSCAGASTTEGLTRDQLAQRYGFGPLYATGATGAGLTMVVIEGTTSVDTALVDRFLSCQGFPGVTVQTHWVAPSSGAPVGNEATVDVETIAEMLPGVGTVHVLQQPGTGSFGARFAATLTYLLAEMDAGRLVPDVISMSIGVCEEAVPQSEVDAIEPQLRRLAEAGVWFMKSAGDAGSSDCAGHDSCATSDTQLAVEYPTTSQWLTAVGGSQFVGETPVGEAVVWKQTCSGGGGGTSTRVARPAWQDGVPGDRAWRVIPDLTGLAGRPHYLTLVPATGHTGPPGWEGDGGTSLSTPMYAAGVALVRQALRARGLPVPALLTNELYRIAGDRVLGPLVFTDVTQGDNDLYGVGCCSAANGFDLASGWGEMDVGALYRVLAGDLPAPVVPSFTG